MTKPVPTLEEHWLKGSVDAFKDDPMATLLNAAITHGPIVKFHMFYKTFHLISGSDYVHEVLVKQSRKFNKSKFDQKILGRVLGNGLLTNNGASHLKQRKLAQPAFHHRRINSYAEIMVDYTERMLNQWENNAVRDMSVDMSEVTMRIVSKTLFDSDVETGADKIGDAVHAAQDVLDRAFDRPIQIPEWIPTQDNRRLAKANEALLNVIVPIIEERLETEADHGDLLSMLVSARDEDGNQMPKKQIIDEAITLFLAGHETTANTMTWALYLLSQHPDVEAKLHAEVDTVLQGRTPNLADLPNLPYTEKVVKETMRHMPAVWSLNGREAIEDVIIDGYVIPAGTIVFVSPYINHHLPEYWENPHQFDPERFSEGFEDSLPKFAYMPFGGGPRVCIGNAFAMMEAQLIMAMVAQKFSLTLDPEQTVEFQPRLTLGPTHGMRMLVKERQLDVITDSIRVSS